MTEALAIDELLKVKGIPVSFDLVRGVLGTPAIEDLAVAPLAANLDFLRFMIDPRAAEGKDIAFTLQASGDSALWLLHLRHGVLVISPAEAPAAKHIQMTRVELAEFTLGRRTLGEAMGFARFDACLDRSGLKPMDQVMASVIGSPEQELQSTAAGEQ